MKLFNILTALVICSAVFYVVAHHVAPDFVARLKWNLTDRHEVIEVDPRCFTDDGDMDAELAGVDCSALS